MVIELAARVDEVAEVSVFHRRSRHGAELRRRRALAVPLAVEHEERLVVPVVQAGDHHGAIDLKSILIEIMVHLRRAARVQQERVRVEPLASVVTRRRCRGTELVPDLSDMLMTPPAVRPYCAS